MINRIDRIESIVSKFLYDEEFESVVVELIAKQIYVSAREETT